MLISALVIVIILLVLSFYPAIINKDEQDASVQVFQCDTLTTGCKASIDNKQLEIRFPENIVFLKRFPIELRITEQLSQVINTVTVDFKMVGMNMGLNFYQLKQTAEDKTLWLGTGILPVCTTGRTDWQAIVSLQDTESVQKVAFQFEVSASTQ